MTTINVSNLILKLQQKIDSTSNEADLLYYSKAMQQLRTGNVFVVDSVADLPNAAQNPGLLYYIKNNKIVYFSDFSGLGWIELYRQTATTIFSWGNNNCGRLGDGTTTTRCSPIREICSATNWCQVSARSSHTAAIKTSGELWAWGRNNCGQLGDGTATDKCSPVREFCSATDWCQASAGGAHTVAIKTCGQLWAWGSNYCGRLGDGTVTQRCSPVREICSATDWCSTSAGYSHTIAIKTSGQLWSWGQNNTGQLGDGTASNKCSPVRERCSATDWCQVSVGSIHTSAIKTSGQLWAWGFNSCGRLGDGTTVTRCSPVREICSATDWCQVSSAGYHAAAIKTNGQLWAWGRNSNGVLGDGTTVQSCSPVREFCSATDWCQVSVGADHTAAIKTSGQIWTWGRNNSGALGDGTTVNQCSPVREFCSATDWCQASSSYHTIAIRIRSSL